MADGFRTVTVDLLVSVTVEVPVEAGRDAIEAAALAELARHGPDACVIDDEVWD